MAGQDAAGIEHAADQVALHLRVALDDFDGPRRFRSRDAALEQAGPARDGIERRAQLMAQGGEELVLHAAGVLGGAPGALFRGQQCLVGLHQRMPFVIVDGGAQRVRRPCRRHCEWARPARSASATSRPTRGEGDSARHAARREARRRVQRSRSAVRSSGCTARSKSAASSSPVYSRAVVFRCSTWPSVPIVQRMIGSDFHDRGLGRVERGEGASRLRRNHRVCATRMQARQQCTGNQPDRATHPSRSPYGSGTAAPCGTAFARLASWTGAYGWAARVGTTRIGARGFTPRRCRGAVARVLRAGVRLRRLNNSFYRLPAPETLRGMGQPRAARVPVRRQGQPLPDAHEEVEGPRTSRFIACSSTRSTSARTSARSCINSRPGGCRRPASWRGLAHRRAVPRRTTPRRMTRGRGGRQPQHGSDARSSPRSAIGGRPRRGRLAPSSLRLPRQGTLSSGGPGRRPTSDGTARVCSRLALVLPRVAGRCDAGFMGCICSSPRWDRRIPARARHRPDTAVYVEVCRTLRSGTGRDVPIRLERVSPLRGPRRHGLGGVTRLVAGPRLREPRLVFACDHVLALPFASGDLVLSGIDVVVLAHASGVVHGPCQPLPDGCRRSARHTRRGASGRGR